MLAALCLDLMDTIVVDPYREALRAATGMELHEIAGARDPGVWPAFETGEIDEDEFVRRFFGASAPAGAAFDIDAFHEARRAGYAILPGMVELIRETRGRVEAHVASNYPVWIDEVVADLGLLGLVDGIHASHELGVRKPAAGFYERLLDRVGHAAGACLFVDDREVNCTAAEAAGLRAHLFTGAGDLRRRLVAEGVLGA